MIAIYRISLSLAGNELAIVRNRPKQPNQNKWRRRLRSDLRFGPVQNEHLVVRTYDRWPLRASGVLDPLVRLARRVKKKPAGPAALYCGWCVRKSKCFNVKAARLCYRLIGTSFRRFRAFHWDVISAVSWQMLRRRSLAR